LATPQVLAVYRQPSRQNVPSERNKPAPAHNVVGFLDAAPIVIDPCYVLLTNANHSPHHLELFSTIRSICGKIIINNESTTQPNLSNMALRMPGVMPHGMPWIAIQAEFCLAGEAVPNLGAGPAEVLLKKTVEVGWRRSLHDNCDAHPGWARSRSWEARVLESRRGGRPDVLGILNTNEEGCWRFLAS